MPEEKVDTSPNSHLQLTSILEKCEWKVNGVTLNPITTDKRKVIGNSHHFSWVNPAVNHPQQKCVKEYKLLSFVMDISGLEKWNVHKIRNVHTSTAFFSKNASEKIVTIEDIIVSYALCSCNCSTSFEELLMNYGYDKEHAWCISIAVRFSTFSGSEWLENFLLHHLMYSRVHINKTVFREIANLFHERFKIKYNIKHVFVGHYSHSEISTTMPSLFAIINKRFKRSTQKEQFNGLAVIFRHQNEFSDEARALMQHERSVSVNVKIKTECITELLNKHTNITLISASTIISRGFNSVHAAIELTSCIVLYCHIKGVIPYGENSFPVDIEDVPVDVREGAAYLAVKEECLRIGDKIGLSDTEGFGTLGGFVDLVTAGSGTKGFITCAHVVCKTKDCLKSNRNDFIANNRIEISDKNYPDEMAEIGLVKKAVFAEKSAGEVSVDAALVEICRRNPEDGEFTNFLVHEPITSYGFQKGEEPYFWNGEIGQISVKNFRKTLIKVGASSGLTLGYLRYDKAYAAILDNSPYTVDNWSYECQMHGQMEVFPRLDPKGQQAFITNGDSGSFVFMIESDSPPTLKCVGMAIATTSYGSCIMTPIQEVLESLHLSKDSLSKFPHRPYRGQDETSKDEPSITSILHDIRSDMAKQADKLEAINTTVLELSSRVQRLEAPRIMQESLHEQNQD